ncbi:hypothetical protein WSPTPLR_05980 [Wolbachia pipientis]|uniref:hypothetical protein n=1 Tax=Wolbachia TaxID=953 RepID=UPI00168078CD|nr:MULTISPECIES: hypothetical protein [Wolbachia]MBA8753235.1 hypothetical protein [Wolbachia pipientis]MDV6248640.1 hypothetical protein [Wolbachia endosymbiont of Zaprionus taronus]UID81008.1 hypothetical protein J4T77_04520 [Wolbachia endosymbiont of Drosophila innubila]
MTIKTSATYYRTTLLSQRLIETVLFSSPLLAYTGPGANDIPNRYSGQDHFLVQPPFIPTAGGLIDDLEFLTHHDDLKIHKVKQKTMRIDYKRVSGLAEIFVDDVKFLFNRDQFPSNVPTSLTSFMERGERVYQELLMQVIRSINDYQFKTIASRGFICAGSTEDSMYDCIEGEVRTLIDYMIRVNGGVLRTSRLVGSMPNSAIGVLRTKSGLNYTQAPKSDMFLSDTKNMLSPLTFDCADIYIDTSTYFHKAGPASKDKLTIKEIVKEMDEYCSMTVTFGFSGSVDIEVDNRFNPVFKKGDIIQLEGKEWLARDRDEIPSGVPIAFTVMKDSTNATVQVSPGITYGVDVPEKEYLIGAKGKVVGNHCKAFFWWQPASIFKIGPVPAPSTNKYLYKEISAPNAAFGPTKNNAMSFLVDSQYVLMNTPYEYGELMAYMYSDFFPFFVGTLILPPKSPKPETYIKTIKNLSTADKKDDKKDE